MKQYIIGRVAHPQGMYATNKTRLLLMTKKKPVASVCAQPLDDLDALIERRREAFAHERKELEDRLAAALATKDDPLLKRNVQCQYIDAKEALVTLASKERHFEDRAQHYLEQALSAEGRKRKRSDEELPDGLSAKKCKLDQGWKLPDLVRNFRVEFEGDAPEIELNQEDDFCPRCQRPMKLSTNGALLICDECHVSSPYMDATSASVSYGDEVEFSSFTYKKLAHFDDWLKKIQGKSNKKLKASEVERVMENLAKLGYRDSKSIDLEAIRKAMRYRAPGDSDDKQARQSDCGMAMLYRITGKMPPHFTPEQEENCRQMFNLTQSHYRKWADIVAPNRKNFLSYSYCLYKFCQLRGYWQYLPYLNLLKGEDKLQKQDAIFKGICKDLDWPWIPSNKKEP